MDDKQPDYSPKRTEATATEYLACALRMRRAAADLRGIEVAHWTEVIGDLIARKASLMSPTFRYYKAALLCAIPATFEHVDSDARVSDALERLENESQTGCAKTSTKTSARRAKRLRADDRAILFAELSRTPTIHSTILVEFLRAGCLTGLRPCEWRRSSHVQVEGNPALTLIVNNAKTTNGRSHGKIRTLFWSEISDASLHSIVAVREWASKFETADEYKKALRQLGDLLHETVTSLWPGRICWPTLYTPRHEFAAQAKRIYSPAQVACLMGHAVDITAATHYGRIGRSKVGPKNGNQASIDHEIELPLPNLLEVERVSKRLESSLKRLYEYSTAKPVTSEESVDSNDNDDESSGDAAPMPRMEVRHVPAELQTPDQMTPTSCQSNRQFQHDIDDMPTPPPRPDRSGEINAGAALWQAYRDKYLTLNLAESVAALRLQEAKRERSSDVPPGAQSPGR